MALRFVDAVGLMCRRFRVPIIFRVIVFCVCWFAKLSFVEIKSHQAQMKLRQTKTMNHPRWCPASTRLSAPGKRFLGGDASQTENESGADHPRPPSIPLHLSIPSDCLFSRCSFGPASLEASGTWRGFMLGGSVCVGVGGSYR